MICVVLPISRTTYLRAVFNCLAELKKPSDTELLIITDGNKDLEMAVDNRLDSISFARVQVVKFGDKPEETRDRRRFRISEIHNRLKHYLPDKCDYVLSLEDDTTYPEGTLNRMLDIMDRYEDCAFVEGVELGRHKSKYVGGWQADDIYNPQRITSVMPSFVGNPVKREHQQYIQDIDAGGLYCALIRADLYKSHHFEPYDKQGKEGLSCDLNFGLYLRNLGFKCLIDWSLILDHIGDKGSVNLGNTTPIQIEFSKRKDQWTSRVVNN